MTWVWWKYWIYGSWKNEKNVKKWKQDLCMMWLWWRYSRPMIRSVKYCCARARGRGGEPCNTQQYTTISHHHYIYVCMHVCMCVCVCVVVYTYMSRERERESQTGEIESERARERERERERETAREREHTLHLKHALREELLSLTARTSTVFVPGRDGWWHAGIRARTIMRAARYWTVERIRFYHVRLGAVEDDLCVTTQVC